MKTYAHLPFVFFLVVGLSGCITSKEFSRSTATLLDEVAQVAQANAQAIAQDKPEHATTAHQAGTLQSKTATHAKADPTPPWINQGKDFLMGALTHPGAGPLGIAGTLALGLMGYQRKKKAFSGLVDDLVKNPNRKECEALRRGIL